ncbi:sirohydrochlorin chelatase [Paraoerskovia marina]|uniref:Sirohydrochlorin ferrochelatase n=1 Tax=Paraoerskovia marina TaxID=545619 RepID=A0A1H1M1V7_9CELL|nr:CbiX/SirB N-terminal domain-containing protein [Paraoerskovia marina]SDR80315.1 Sirohydrochlorin ferrochelatase [Paraoerskovia marina]
MTTSPRNPAVLVGCSHGTDSPDGQAAVTALLDDVRARRPDLDVRETYVDVQHPQLPDVLAGVVEPGAPGAVGDPTAEPQDAVVVPLLLSAGFHVYVDVTEAVADHDAATADAVRTGALGPDPRLVEILRARLASVGLLPGDAVVLGAAGSSDARAVEAVEEVAEGLRARLEVPVTIGYGSKATPTVPEAVAAAREAGATRVVIAAYLLAPGVFLDKLADAGADVVTDALAPDPLLTDIVLDRYADGVAALGA